MNDCPNPLTTCHCLNLRGNDERSQSGMFSYVPLEQRISADHPLLAVRKLVDTVLAQMPKDFGRLCGNDC